MRRKLTNSRWKCIIFFSSILLTLKTVVFGVPLNISYLSEDNFNNEQFVQENERDDRKITDSNCIVNGSTYEEGNHIPGAGPCEECICHPPNVVCSMIKCPVNSGCITIQLPNKCCPKYKCDCEHKGKLYNNGEKVNKSDESACRICFCNGGAIVCTTIVCYTRNDCQGYYLPGDCCPKYDNCSSTLIEKKPRELINIENSPENSSMNNINDWSYSTEPYYNIWKRDTVKTQKQELSTVSNTISIQSIYFNTAKLYRNNISTSNELFDVSTLSPTLNENITLMENYNEINVPHNFRNNITVGDLNITSFLGFEIDNSTINEETVDPNLINYETSTIIPQFSDLFDTTDIDNSVIITHQNDTGTIISLIETSTMKEIIDSTIETTTNTQIEIFDPNYSILDSKESIIEFSTVTSQLDATTEIDYEESKKLSTSRVPDKSTIPHKLVISSQKTIEDELNKEIAFTYLEDTTNISEPNFGHNFYNIQVHESLINLDTVDPKNNYTIHLPTLLTNNEDINKTTSSEYLQNKLFDEPFSNYTINSIENSTSIKIDNDSENISFVTNEVTEINNGTNSLDLKGMNITSCMNCTNNLKLNDELLASQAESTTTTPFIIETKVLPNQASPQLVIKKMQYPKEYPEEFETIQYGPSLTITKKTYTSIPDIVYTTTTMVTLPTLDLIYKADKEIEKYLTETQYTTIKPSNNLSPLRNVSFIT